MIGEIERELIFRISIEIVGRNEKTREIQAISILRISNEIPSQNQNIREIQYLKESSHFNSLSQPKSKHPSFLFKITNFLFSFAILESFQKSKFFNFKFLSFPNSFIYLPLSFCAFADSLCLHRNIPKITATAISPCPLHLPQNSAFFPHNEKCSVALPVKMPFSQMLKLTPAFAQFIYTKRQIQCTCPNSPKLPPCTNSFNPIT